jgi:putative Holliday junction resolvase
MPRILAFDYGLKRTGVAVTDPLQIIANGLDTLPTEKLLLFIKDYCNAEEVELFVVGYPFNHGHGENDIARHIDKFILKLRQLYPAKQVVKVDETFTSKMAAQTLLMSGVNKKERRRRENLDVISATIILQSYMESRGR